MTRCPAVWERPRPAEAAGRAVPSVRGAASSEQLRSHDSQRFHPDAAGPRRHRRRRSTAYVPLKKAGANYEACCPFHSEKTPSFTVSPTKQFYHCFGCGAHGTAIGFLMEHAGKSFPDAVEELARDAGLEVPRVERAGERERREEATDLCDDAARPRRSFYRAQLKDAAARDRLPEAPRADRRDRRALRHRLRARRLAAAGRRLSRLRRPGARGRGPGHHRRRRQALRPLPRPHHVPDPRQRAAASSASAGACSASGEPKYLNSPETPLFSKGRELYGLFLARDAIRDAGRVVVVEGYMDVVALAQHGVEYAVATLGTATTPVHAQKLFRLDRHRRVLLRRRRRGPQGRVARAGEHAAGARRRQERALPVPARRRGSRRFRPRARQGGVRAGDRRGDAAVRVPAGRTRRAASAGIRRGARRAGRRGAPAARRRSRAPILGALLRRRLAELAGLPEDRVA